MSQLLHLGEVVSRNARLFPNKLGARDLARSMTYRQWNERSCRLANALLGLGLAKGDRVAILAYNCVEWLEIYVALAKAGLVAVPINFRLVGPEIQYIVDDAEARAFIIQDDLFDKVESIRSDLSLAQDTYLHFGGMKTPPGYQSYEALIEGASASEPPAQVLPEDAGALMYTSGTTGKPKGAIRSHESLALLALITANLLRAFPLKHVGQSGGELDVLEAARNLPFGVGEYFAVLTGQDGGQLGLALCEDFADPEEDVGPLRQARRPPGGQRGRGSGDGFLYPGSGSERNLLFLFSGGRVEHGAKALGIGNAAAVDVMRNGVHESLSSTLLNPGNRRRA